MAKKYDGYTPMGPLAAGLGLAAASLAAANPVTSPAAATIGTMVAGFASGITLTDEEKNIKEKFDDAMKRTWHQIFVKYGLTDKCFLELQQDVIGCETSTEEFVSNLSRRNFEESLASVIQTILKRQPQSQILWDGTLRTYSFLLASNSLRKKYSSSGSP